MMLMLYPIGMKPTVPETGTIIRIEGENAVIMIKGGGLAGVRQVHMPVAKKLISDIIFTGEVKSEEERWYLKYTRHNRKTALSTASY